MYKFFPTVVYLHCTSYECSYCMCYECSYCMCYECSFCVCVMCVTTLCVMNTTVLYFWWLGVSIAEFIVRHVCCSPSGQAAVCC